MGVSPRGVHCPLPACISEQDTTSTDSPKEKTPLYAIANLDISLQNIEFPESRYSKVNTGYGLHILVHSIFYSESFY